MSQPFQESEDENDFVISHVPQPPPLPPAQSPLPAQLPPLSAIEKGDSMIWVWMLVAGFLGFFFLLVAVFVGGVYYLLFRNQGENDFARANPPLEINKADAEHAQRNSVTNKDDNVAFRNPDERKGIEPPFVPPAISNGNPHSQSSGSEFSDSQRPLQTVKIQPLGSLPNDIQQNRPQELPGDPALTYDLSPKNSFYVYFSSAAFSGGTLSGNCRFTPTTKSPLEAIRNSDDFDPEQLAQGGGTGFIVHPDGIVVTCAHVVENIPAITVTLGDQKLPAVLLSIDHEKDLAVLKINVKDSPYLALDDQQSALGDPARVFGFPLTEQLGRSLKMSTGSVSGFDQTEHGTRIQMDAVANPGNSGGPVTNNQGVVIGVVDSILTGSEVSNLSFAVPAKEVMAELLALGIPFQKLKSQSKPEGDSLLAAQLRDVSHAVVRVGHSQDLKERWTVVDYHLTAGNNTQKGSLLVDRTGNCINLSPGLYTSTAMHDLATIGFLPLPSTAKKEWEAEDSALISKTITERRGGNSPLDIHRQMMERMRPRFGPSFGPGFGGVGGIDPFEHLRGATGATSNNNTREVVQLVRWTDKYKLQDGAAENENLTGVDWQRETSTKEISSQANETADSFSGAFYFDREAKKLKSGYLKRNTGNKGTTLSFSIKSNEEVEQQQKAAAERRRIQAEKVAKENEQRRQRQEEADKRLDQLNSRDGTLSQYEVDQE